MAKGKSGSYRSAISGRYVTSAHGRRSPHTTVHEAKNGGSTGSHRSAITGRFVTGSHAARNPRTTTKES